MSFLIYFYYFLIYSFIGWIIDTTYSSLKSKKFINRSFLTEPLSPIYGLSAIVIIITSYKFHENLILFFIVSSITSSVLEYFSSLFFDKIYHIKWWNYSKKPFNLNGRICLEYILYWGILSILILNTIHSYINQLSYFLTQKIGIIGILLFLIILFIDTIYTFGSLHRFNQILTKPLNKIKLNHKIKRLIQSFPKITSKKFKLVQKIR